MSAWPEPLLGDRVATVTGATGRYLCDGLALVVSAQDNDLCVFNVTFDREPHPSLPVPSTDEVMGAVAALRYRSVRQPLIAEATT